MQEIELNRKRPSLIKSKEKSDHMVKKVESAKFVRSKVFIQSIYLSSVEMCLFFAFNFTHLEYVNYILLN